MPRQSASGATDTSGVAQGRFNVQLPAELRPMLDEIGESIRDALRRAKVPAVSLSLAQIVGSVVEVAHAELKAAQAAESANGSGEPAAVAAPEGEPAAS